MLDAAVDQAKVAIAAPVSAALPRARLGNPFYDFGRTRRRPRRRNECHDRELERQQPIYRQLRDRVVAMILDGVLKEGDPLPSVRNVAAEYRVNPLTVLKGYQQLVDEELVEKRRGAACSSTPARATCCCRASARSSSRKSGPASRERIQRLGLTAEELLTAEPPRRRRAPSKSPVDQGEAAMACIEARGLRKAYGTTVALDGVDLRVEEGRIVGLIGPNGAGKTTALKAILGLTSYRAS